MISGCSITKYRYYACGRFCMHSLFNRRDGYASMAIEQYGDFSLWNRFWHDVGVVVFIQFTNWLSGYCTDAYGDFTQLQKIDAWSGTGLRIVQ